REHMLENEAQVAISISNDVAQKKTPVFLKLRLISGQHSGMFESMSLPILGRDDETIWLFGASFFPETT
ncbi:MAG: hypothetical protein P1V34_03400, partial [Alphaproteobacteria bacterium]|nr:hypothetical protein [Alphaproteobacteria bacterium]